MISDIDYIRNDVADMKADLKVLARVVEDIAVNMHSIQGTSSEIQATVDQTSERLRSMEEKFIAMNVIYPDIINA